MSDSHHDEKPLVIEDKPALEEDAKLARVLGLVLLGVLSVFGFYYGTVFGKTNAVDGVRWYYDYQGSDVVPGLQGAGIGFLLALAINLYIWFRYKAQTDEDLKHEWYEPQTHRHAGHH